MSTTLITPKNDSHLYTANGEAMHTIIGKNGKRRKTTLADARKLNLFFSVTSILKLIHNPFLESWKINTAILAARTLPKKDNESEEEFVTRVIEDYGSTSRLAMEFGSSIHNDIERINLGKAALNAKIAEYIEKYIEWKEERIGKVLAAEQVVVNHDHGYAGTLDLHAVHKVHGPVVIDFKTQAIRQGREPNFYENFPLQLAAYRECLPDKPRCLSVVINSTSPELPHEKLWNEEAIENSWLQFFHANRLFQLKKNYKPECSLADKSPAEMARVVTEAAAEVFDVTPREILGRRRKEPIVTARQVSYYLLRKCGLKYERIGEVFERDHAAVIHGCKRIGDLSEVDKKMKIAVCRLENMVMAT